MRSEESDWDAVIIGAGAAGLLAAIRASERGRRVLVIEKNPRPGAKILMSGGGRCNLTHDTDARGIAATFGPPGRFLHSALTAFGPRDIITLMESEGVPTRTEEGGKVFPLGGKSSDVLEALLRYLRRGACAIAIGEPVKDLSRDGDGFLLSTSRRTLRCGRVVVTTGGRSYPACGTTGDGYRWARALRHTVAPPRPALVPVTVKVPWVRELRGLSIPDADVRVTEAPGGRPLARSRGAILFAHFGLSGPAILDVSRAVRCPGLALECDLLPGLPVPDIEGLLRKAASSSGKKKVEGVFPEVLPRRLGEVLTRKAGLPLGRKAAELTKDERVRFVESIKRLRLPLSGTLGFDRAEVTAGGVALDEVDPRSMESRVVPGLFFAGEMLDLDGPVGGYNLQAAFSTGWAAGANV